MDWRSLIRRVVEMAQKFGTPVTIVRVAQTAPANPWEPSAQTEATNATHAILLSYEDHVVNGTSILAGDVKAMTPATVTEPAVGDYVIVNGERYRVVSVQPSQPGGVAIYYNLQLRR